MSRRFDTSLGGLSFNEFIILYHLSQTKDNKLSRIELAEKLGLTASGITRLLLPMEKIGLIKREQHQSDARMSWINLANGGKQKLSDAIERAELLVESVKSLIKSQNLSDLNAFLIELGKT